MDERNIVFFLEYIRFYTVLSAVVLQKKKGSRQILRLHTLKNIHGL